MNSNTAVFELGTNTFKYLVGSPQKVLQDKAFPLRLGAKLQSTGTIPEDVATKAIEQILCSLKEIQAYHIERIICVGAMTLRKASNAEDFIKRVKEETGLHLRVLTEKEEAELAFKAATMDACDSEDKAVLDLGGGSLELIFGSYKIKHSYSLALGAVILTDRYIHSDPPSQNSLSLMQEYIKRSLEQNIIKEYSSRLIAIGGSATNLASICQKTKISKKELQDSLELLKMQKLAERKLVKGLDPERADIIIAGSMVILELLNFLALDAFEVSHRGIRHALSCQM